MEYKSTSSYNQPKEDVDTPNAKEKHIEKMMVTPVKVKKPSAGRTIASLMIADEIENVKKHILMDVVVPSVKKVISEAFSSGIDMLLYGEDIPSSKKGSASRVSYRSYHEKPTDKRNEVGGYRTGHSYDDIILETRQQAVEVLSRMDELIEAYGTVSIADMYELLDLSVGSHTDQKYGWTDLRNAAAIRVKDGYLLKLPRAIPI